MIVYRLSKEIYKNDLSGIGAEKFGGRWNNKGTRMIYTAQSRALANLEIAVHLAFTNIPKNYYLTTIQIPDEFIFTYDQKYLKNKNWKSIPPINFTQIEGDKFVKENGLILKVPSAIVQGDYNYLINPTNEKLSQVKVLESELFSFDSRLFKAE